MPQCFDFEYVLAPWARKLPVDVSFRRVPAMVVHGRYQAITPGSYGGLIEFVDRLVARVRTEAGGK